MTTVDETLSRPDPGVAGKARRAAVHTFRPRRSWPALIAAAVLLIVAALAAAEVVSALAGVPLRILPYQQAADYASSARWSDPPIRIASGVLALIGVLLIALALVPGQGRWLPLRTDDAQLVVGLSTPSLRRALAAAAREVDGVRNARVKVGRRRITVNARTELRESEELSEQVQAAVERRLSELSPARDFTVRTHVQYAKA